MPNILLRPSKAPNLLLAPPLYDSRYLDQLNNALRLYFNQVDNDWSAVLGDNGGQYFQFPHIAASDSTEQYATGSNVPTIVKFNTLDSGSGFTLNAPGSATCNVSGIYKITYSAQIANTANDIHQAVFWLKENNVDIPNSATIFTIRQRKNATTPAFVCGYSEVVFLANAGDIVELWWATDAAYNPVGPVDGVYLHHESAWTTPAKPYARPAVPSVIGSITFVSRPPTTP